MGDLKFGSSPSGHARVGRCPRASIAMPRKPSLRDAQRAFTQFKQYRITRKMNAPERSPEPSSASSSRARDHRRPYDETLVSKWSVICVGLLAHHEILVKAEFHQAVSAKWDRLEMSRVRLDELD